MLTVYKGRGYAYTIQYHIVWCVKYRHKIITCNIKHKLIEIINKIALDNRVTILEFNTELDTYTY